jgi:hypothetical protein
MHFTELDIDDYWAKIDELYYRKLRGEGNATREERKAVAELAIAIWEQYMRETSQQRSEDTSND